MGADERGGGSYDAIVVGVGAMGAACCEALARRGERVLGLEQFDIPNTLGSSGGQSRLIRLAYYEHPDYVPLLRHAYASWDALSERLGARLLYRTGCLYLGRAEDELIAGSWRAAQEHGLAVERLCPRDIAARHPRFRVPEHFSGLYEPDAGLVLCERALAGCAELALRGGAELHAHERVQAWWPDGDGVAVRTERGTYRAGRLVLAAGAWAEQLVGELGVALRVTRQAVGWVWPSVPEPFELGRFPCWAIQHDAPGFEGIYYGFPLLPAARFAGERGIKVGHHALGANVDPDRVDRTPSAADEADFRPALERYLPQANGPTLALRVCLYTMSPDRHFIVDRHPRHPQVIMACGFSGHGFKFATVLGEALADLALEGRSTLPVEFLSLARFGTG